MSDSRPRVWLDILAKIKALDPAQLVPGHGELAILADVIVFERYIHELLQITEQNLRDNGSAESAATLQPPAFAEGWGNAEGFALNMKFLRELMQPK